MTMHPDHSGERGQAIVLLVLALVVMLGFSALALDGGALYTEQRRAQAAADNAVMAAAYQQMKEITSTTQLEAAALANALTNDYDDASADTVVDFNKPPTRGPYVGNNDYMEVIITQGVHTSLAHFIYRQNPIPVTVYAVARGRSSRVDIFGYAIAALRPGCDQANNTIGIQGRGGGAEDSGGTYITDGGAFINSSCGDALESSGHDPFYTDALTVPINMVGGYSPASNVCTEPGVPAGCTFYPPPTTGMDPVTSDPLEGTPASDPPDCNALPMRSLYGAGGELNDADGPTIRPGRYSSLDPGNSFHGTMTLLPGIYCLYGGTLSPGGGAIIGENVLLYLADQPSTINTSGNNDVLIRLTAPTKESTGCANDPDQNICAYLGLVIYKKYGYNTCEQNDVEIDFTGQAHKELVGTVYAPYSLIRYGGNGDLTQIGQTIAGCVKFNGNGRIDIVFDPDAIFQPTPFLQKTE